LISVALPVVKTRFLKDSIESILQQTFPDYELIIVNNGSKEDVNNIVRNYNDSRIRYIEHNEMIPIVENWNRCLSYATGEYFILFSDDDRCEKNFLEEMNNLVLKYPEAKIFRARVSIIDENNSVKAIASSSPEFESCCEFVWHRIKNYRLHYAPDFMVRTEDLKKIGGFINFPNAWGSDDATWFTLANIGGIAASDKLLVNWRDSSFNLTKTGNIENKLYALSVFQKWQDNFIRHELKYTPEESIIFNDILKNLNFRNVVQSGQALRFPCPTRFSSVFTMLSIWLRYRVKYSLSIFSLVWGIALLVKDLRLRN
jgi:glycosyltransferase involved in cell wall biosynthesis